MIIRVGEGAEGTFGFHLASVAASWAGQNSAVILNWPNFSSLPPKKGEKPEGTFHNTAHRLRCGAERAQTWLIFSRTEMFWHVYLFNLFILTSSDYNWQQWAALTLGSVLDLSVTIMQKAFEAKFSKGVTRAGVRFSKKQGEQMGLEFHLPTDGNNTGPAPQTKLKTIIIITISKSVASRSMDF